MPVSRRQRSHIREGAPPRRGSIAHLVRPWSRPPPEPSRAQAAAANHPLLPGATLARMSTGSSGVSFVRVLVTVVAATGVLMAAGCGSDETTTQPSTTTAPAPTTTGAPQPTTSTVQVDNMKFAPSTLTVRVGDTVTWKFSDSTPHAVQGIGDTAMGINSPIFTEGEWSHTFTTPGTYRYLCPLHPEMRGTVTVR